jgi:general secretion pathway protein G
MKRNLRRGFTLMELLIVMAIIVALFALLLPNIFNRQKQSYISQADIKIKSLEGNLELYANQNRGYPTTEQGLNALIFIPDNVGQAVQQPLSGGNPGQPADQMMIPQGQGDAMGGNAASLGPEALNAVPGQNPMQNIPGTPGAMPNDPMGGQANAMNPMGGSIGAGMTASTWNQPTFNPQLYTQQRKRPAPYVDDPKELFDPWGIPYRYENNLAFNGLNRTGSAKPAIWSAGPDKIDYTDDDVRNWDPIDAQQQITLRQQQMQEGGMGTDPMGINPMGADPMGNNQPMGGQPGGIPTAPPMPPQPNAAPMPTAPPMPQPTGI